MPFIYTNNLDLFLKYVVIAPMHFAFSEKRELLETDLILAASQLIPLSKTAKEQLDSLKDWASSGRARPASLIMSSQ